MCSRFLSSSFDSWLFFLFLKASDSWCRKPALMLPQVSMETVVFLLGLRTSASVFQLDSFILRITASSVCYRDDRGDFYIKGIVCISLSVMFVPLTPSGPRVDGFTGNPRSSFSTLCRLTAEPLSLWILRSITFPIPIFSKNRRSELMISSHKQLGWLPMILVVV